MKVFYVSILAFCLLWNLPASAQILQGSNAQKVVSGAETVRVNPASKVPQFVRFESQKQIHIDALGDWVNQFYDSKNDFGLQLIRSETDQLGMTHYRYQQTYKGTPVEFAVIIAHTRNDMVVSVNGEFPDELNVQPAGLSDTQGLNYATNHIGATQYKWQMPEEEAHLRWETNDPEATYTPHGQLVIVAKDADLEKGDFRMAWKFDIYAHQPLKRAIVYVDANTGEILFENNLLHTEDHHHAHDHGDGDSDDHAEADVVGTANTGHSGTQDITADSFNGIFRLRETGRGNGVETYNMQQGTSYGNSVDFEDADNFWNNFNPQLDEFATDAHWGAEMTYDYLLQKHSRNSIDGNGFTLRSYVHYDQNYVNAFWDGFRMTYGDGNNNFLPLTTMDIAGHEIVHGLTTNSAGLIYQDESGALNESFSDIFGTAVEFFALGGQANWTIGEGIGNPFRSMENPGANGDPDTYFGGNWFTGTGDNGGVHTNSGVQNFWFYLLSTGGSGTNDQGDAYNVANIGIDKAGEVAFRNLTVYLTPSSNYEDARFFGIESARDLYGNCSPEMEAVTNAWYAVGVGDEYVAGVQSDFTTVESTSCSVPFTVDFTNLSNNATSYSWDFGDGNSSTSVNPSHTYSNFGSYTVELYADGGSCGNDTKTVTAFIDIVAPVEPDAPNQVVCQWTQGTLTASGNGTLRWYDAPTGGNLLHIGPSYTTPVLWNPTTYYVEDAISAGIQTVGKEDLNVGGGGVYNSGDRHLVFDVHKPMTLVSVELRAFNTGNRTIELRDNNGTVLDDTTVFVNTGISRVTLDFDILPGTDYQLGVAAGSSPALYRSSGGINYPYQIAGLVDITTSNANSPLGFYYFFYDWEVIGEACVSPRKEVQIEIDICSGIEEANNGEFILNLYPNPVKDQLTIDLTPVQEEIEVSLMDGNGRLVSRQTVLPGAQTISVETAGLAKGVYHLQMQSANLRSVRKVLVMP